MIGGTIYGDERDWERFGLDGGKLRVQFWT